MLKSYKQFKGFTLVELMIVIVIIAILATIGIAAFGAQTRNARDAKRTANADSLSSALEVYYADKGVYPSLVQLNTQSWRDTNLPNLSPDALAAGTQTQLQALSTSGDGLAVVIANPLNTSDGGIYYTGYNGAYSSTAPTGTTCNPTVASGNGCPHFMISYGKENGGADVVVSSRQ